MKQDMCKDMSVDPRFLGLETLMSPFSSLCSSQRLVMYGSHLPQAVVINGGQLPHLFTGFESAVGSYEWGDRWRHRPDCIISNIIPKHTCVRNNDSLIIYTSNDGTNKIGYLELKEISNNHKFGYRNKLVNNSFPEIGDYIQGKTKITTSEAHDEDCYKLGINANVAFLSIPEVSEDAFVISRSLANSMSHLAVDNMVIKASYDDIMLNLFGADDEYRVFPDIGERVGADGIILGIRRNREGSQLLADIKGNNLNKPLWMHDDLFRVPPGSEIIDIDIYFGKDRKKIKDPEYAQLRKYNNEQYSYYQAIIDTCNRLLSDGYVPDVDMSALLTRALSITQEQNDYKLKMVANKVPINILIDITYAWTRKVDCGYKSTGREGAKGVFSTIWEDKDMPVDDYGLRADLIIEPKSAPARMNTGQLVEQFINRSSEIIRQRLIRNELGNTTDAYKYIIGYINDIRPAYAALLDKQCGKDKASKQTLLDAIIDDGIFMQIPPYLDTEYEKIILLIEKKYDIRETPVEYNFISDGKLKHVRTLDTCCIGSKYIYLLNKIPPDNISATEFGHVSQFNTPVKAGSKNTKHQSMELKQTPLRLGEDESSILTMCCGSNTTFRLSSLYANSPNGTVQLQRDLLTIKEPTKLTSVQLTNEDLAKANINIQLASHMLGICGFEHNIINQKG